MWVVAKFVFMKSARALIFLFIVGLSSNLYSNTRINCFPENGMFIPTYIEGSGITWEQYEEAIKRVQNEYSPDFKSMGRKLEIISAWRDAEVQAYASSQGKTDQVTVNGGMARFPFMTADALTLVICHELGHHIGGAPQALFYNGKTIEGQADYFATLKCMRRIFSHDDNRRFLSDDTIDPQIRKECKTSFSFEREIAICHRSALASLVMGYVNAGVHRQENPKFNTPDQTRAEHLFTGHPNSQCRLDTYMAGVFCPVQTSLELSSLDLDIGACSRWYGQKRGVRPLCWYDEKLNFTYYSDMKLVTSSRRKLDY